MSQSDKWDSRFMRLAIEAATWSKDPSRKVGAVVVAKDKRAFSFGYNGFPCEIPDDLNRLQDRTYRLRHTVHAEANAISQAPFSLVDATLYCTYYPCEECAIRISYAYIKRVVYLVPPVFHHPHWGRSWCHAAKLFEQYGIKTHHLGDTNNDG